MVLKDLTGMQFGRWTVIRREGSDKYKHPLWMCICECGNESCIAGAALVRGKSLSCGCLQKEMLSNKQATHRMSHTKEHKAWLSIKKRCYKKDSQDYSNYGGRGIKVCNRWLESFENFFEDMGYAPTPKHSIDRIDVNGDYSPENCRWATPKQQANNTRFNKYVIFNGEKMTLHQVADATGVDYLRLWDRYSRRGWELDRAINEPTYPNRIHK